MSIEIKNLCFSYEDGTQALKDVSLSIGRGERVALLGRNGSGKSTLARHLNGLLRPQRGEVLLHGEPTARLRVAQLARSVALLFQNPDDQICKGSVQEEACFGPVNLGYERERVQELAMGALKDFGLSDHAGVNPHDLGYSERKRLALASVFAMDTEIVLLDEPTAGLDVEEIAMLEAVLCRVKERGRSVVLISHDMDFVAENVSRAVCLDAGRKCFDGAVGKLFADTDLMEACGLIAPQIARLSAHFGLIPETFTPEGFLNGYGAKKIFS